MLIDANNDSVVRELKDGDTISKSDYRRFSIEAITDGPAESVVFTSNGRDVRTESFEPYLIASDWYGDFHPWNVSNGTYEITATPFTADSAGGLEGEARTITVTVRR